MKRFLFTLLLVSFLWIGDAQNVVVVIIDGARYTETFGDPERRFVKFMDSLAHEGTIIDSFYNRHKTYTSQAIPALWTGSWAGTRDTVYNGKSTQYTVRPSVFEYYRKQKQANDEKCIYVLKYVSSLWLQSFYPGYGPQYWPYTVSEGSNDIEVEQRAKDLASLYHPQFLWVYLADVDHAGHSGDWSAYTSAIKRADSLVYDLWTYLQNDDFYKDNTYLFVTNDHGRHDDQHGGFRNHGDDCQGCQHIMFLALGPDIYKDYVVDKEYEMQDFAVTVSYALGVNPEYADGRLIDKIFRTSAVVSHKDNDDLIVMVDGGNIFLRLGKSGKFRVEVYNISGKMVFTDTIPGGIGEEILMATSLESGVYLLRYLCNGEVGSRKIVVLP